MAISAGLVFVSGIIGVYLALWIFASNSTDFSVCSPPSTYYDSCLYKKAEDQSAAEKLIRANMGYTNAETNPPSSTDNIVDKAFTYYSCYDNPSTDTNPLDSTGMTTQFNLIGETSQLSNNLCILMGCSYKQCILIESSCNSDGTFKDLNSATCVDPSFRSSLPVLPFALGGLCLILGSALIVMSCLCFKER
uniref:Uncharacterized protein n=1 Tax=Chromera velia CCMP2878 TaxID=1169474 RepID=A0A0G4FRY6_9ALVE|eukprot:Cvel_3649.t1-p1 / transcript=Cvel_3649.t1 / gene=Cvel_3649 / organism=Chromera_velia_CCMP2878 / gene_product=hypothetical protein / transcript_product=hypothetical protein / location=Cvel_scaffold151:19481-22519(-) / protein_length=191 / sequence_SO=supercontig / SO=protein_coding / is_pseudo=false